ncbi:MAG: hypothetical protein ACYDCO_09955 [Armatimonadota bacterium]
MTEETPVQQPAEDAAAEQPKPERVSFFTLNPRKIGRSRLVRALAVGLCIVSFSIVPLWRLLWYFPAYGFADFLPTRDVNGRFRAAWHWIDGKEIRIYPAPGVSMKDARTIEAGVQEMMDEVPLDFTVKALPMPPEVLKAYEESLVTKKDGQEMISYNRLRARLVTLREGDPHADMLVVKQPITECSWAHGMASFTSGVGVLVEGFVDERLGKHESCHLIGYHYHDSLPLFIAGYPWEGPPWNSDTLMVLYGGNNELSPRARDALRYFWRGMERRSGKQFLK